MPRVFFALLLLLAALLPHGQEARASTPAATRAHTTVLPYGTRCRYYAPEITFPGPRPGYHCIYPGPVYLDLAPKIRHTPAKKAAKKAPVRRAAAPRGRSGYYWTTGYSWGCGTPNGRTASGTIPYVGTVANDWLPFGTHIFVPSLGYYGVVLDRGQGMGGFDLFAPNCAATYAYTGRRLVTMY